MAAEGRCKDCTGSRLSRAQHGADDYNRLSEYQIRLWPEVGDCIGGRLVWRK